MGNRTKDAGVNRTRRRVLGTMGLALAYPGLAGASVVERSRGADSSLALRYDRPAGQWVEALPVGNGRLGAMVFGRPAQERLQLNEDTLYAGGPYRFDNPDSLAALPRVRALIDAGRYREASDLVGQAMISKPATQMPYGAAGDLLLDFHGLKGAAGYRRTLDLDSAIASTQFVDGATRHLRETFASAPDGVLVLHLAATGPGALDFDLGYRHPRAATYGAAAGQPDFPWDGAESLHREERPASLSIGPDGAHALLVEGRNIAHAGVDGALRYAVRVLALGDGRIEADGDGLRVRGARAVTLLIGAATSFVNFREVDGDPVQAVRAATEAAARKPYARLRADHVAAHGALFRRLRLRIGDDAPANAATDAQTTDARIAAAPEADDATLATLAALYLQYGRYLLLSSSRPGSQPANLQGIWNEGVNPPWGGKFTININTEMNYWPAEAANLAECVEPMLHMVEDLAASGERTAREGYGARGWVAHHNTDLWRATAPIDGPNWGMWPCGGAWLCKTLWDHYDYRPDPAFLRRIYPLLKGASLFFVDTLVEDPKGRGLVTSPSISPENEHHPGVAVCAGPAMDRQIVRDLFGWTLAAHRLLATKADPDDGFARTLEAMRARLAPDRIGAQGQLQEWLEDWDAQAPEPRHRHVSHLYAVYPGEQINVRDTPELAAAARVALDRRGDMSTGWATAWRLALWARLGDGERAYGILRGLLGPERTYPNMFDAHPPFQIDGNFGGSAGILEMLVQSWGGELHLLPALPRAWPAGSLHGVRARGGLELDLDWRGGRLRRLALRGQPGQRVLLRVDGRSASVLLDSRGRGQFEPAAAS